MQRQRACAKKISLSIGKPKDERRKHGVGFAVKNSLLKMVKPPTEGLERILTMRLNTTSCPITLISVYAPNLMVTPDAKDKFYENLCATINKAPSKDQVILLGDLMPESAVTTTLGLPVLEN